MSTAPSAATSKPAPAPVPVLEYVLLLVLATLWGSSFSFVKIAVETIPPITAMTGRALIAGLALWIVLRISGGRMPMDTRSLWRLARLSMVLTVIPFVLIAWGLKWVDAGLGVILNATTPIFAFLITLIITRQEEITFRKAFGVLAGVTGVALIVGTSALSGLGDQLVPQFALILASVSYATSAIYGRSFQDLGQFVPAAACLTFGGAILAPIALIVEQPWTASPSWESVAALVIVALFGTALGNLLYFRLLGTLGSLATTSQAFLRVPIGVGVGMLMLGESLAASAIVGMLCVVVGVTAMTLPRGTRLLGRRL